MLSKKRALPILFHDFKIYRLRGDAGLLFCRRLIRDDNLKLVFADGQQAKLYAAAGCDSSQIALAIEIDRLRLSRIQELAITKNSGLSGQRRPRVRLARSRIIN